MASDTFPPSVGIFTSPGLYTWGKGPMGLLSDYQYIYVRDWVRTELLPFQGYLSDFVQQPAEGSILGFFTYILPTFMSFVAGYVFANNMMQDN